jgi:hypothetical protein
MCLRCWWLTLTPHCVVVVLQTGSVQLLGQAGRQFVADSRQFDTPTPGKSNTAGLGSAEQPAIDAAFI